MARYCTSDPSAAARLKPSIRARPASTLMYWRTAVRKLGFPQPPGDAVLRRLEGQVAPRLVLQQLQHVVAIAGGDRRRMQRPRRKAAQRRLEFRHGAAGLDQAEIAIRLPRRAGGAGGEFGETLRRGAQFGEDGGGRLPPRRAPRARGRVGGDQDVPGVPGLRAAEALAIRREPAPAGRLVGLRHHDLGGDEGGDGFLLLLRRRIMALAPGFRQQELADDQGLGRRLPGRFLRRGGVVLHLGGDRRLRDGDLIDADHRTSPAIGRAAPRRRTSW